ncbi:hypothetical protein, partial [Salmonella enterica]|uniref:hypothetical protein n=1 Tax=Salmonella enterica TaxID=28901 RepID=UPI003CE74276
MIGRLTAGCGQLVDLVGSQVFMPLVVLRQQADGYGAVQSVPFLVGQVRHTPQDGQAAVDRGRGERL